MLRNESLRALLALNHSGSIARAAKSTNKTASQISHSVSSLEEDLGIPLLSREGYRAELTPQGQLVASQSLHLLNELEDIDSRIAALAQPEPELTRLSIALLDALPATPFAQDLWQLQQFQPDLALTVEQLHTCEIVQRLEQGTLDFGIAFYHRNAHPGLSGQIIGQAEIITVVAPQHPLASQPRHASSDERLKHLQLLPASFKGFGLDSLTRTTDNYWLLKDFDLMISLLEQGLGWAELPRYQVEPQLKAGTLVQYRDKGACTFWGHLQLLWHKERQLSHTGHWLIERLSAPRPGLSVTTLPL